MSLDHEAIYKAYEGVVFSISDREGAFDKDGKNVALEQSKIDAARTELNKLKYKTDRTTDGSKIYASWREQLSMLYDDMVAGKLDKTGTFFAHNKEVKDANPKP